MSVAEKLDLSSGRGDEKATLSRRKSALKQVFGFVTDTLSMMYSLPDFKMEDIKRRISEIIEKSSLRELAHVVGKIASVERAVFCFHSARNVL